MSRSVRIFSSASSPQGSHYECRTTLCTLNFESCMKERFQAAAELEGHMELRGWRWSQGISIHRSCRASIPGPNRAVSENLLASI